MRLYKINQKTISLYHLLMVTEIDSDRFFLGFTIVLNDREYCIEFSNQEEAQLEYNKLIAAWEAL
jgi:hypothetical protein